MNSHGPAKLSPQLIHHPGGLRLVRVWPHLMHFAPIMILQSPNQAVAEVPASVSPPAYQSKSLSRRSLRRLFCRKPGIRDFQIAPWTTTPSMPHFPEPSLSASSRFCLRSYRPHSEIVTSPALRSPLLSSAQVMMSGSPSTPRRSMIVPEISFGMRRSPFLFRTRLSSPM